MTGVRHARSKGQAVNTKYGLLQLDSKGRVVEIPKGATKEKLLTLPNFLDEELFPLSEPKAAPSPPPPPPPVLPTKEELQLKEESEDDEVKSFLQTLAEDPKNLNSAGKLDLGRVNSALRSAGIKAISAAKRDELMG